MASPQILQFHFLPHFSRDRVTCTDLNRHAVTTLCPNSVREHCDNCDRILSGYLPGAIHTISSVIRADKNRKKCGSLLRLGASWRKNSFHQCHLWSKRILTSIKSPSAHTMQADFAGGITKPKHPWVNPVQMSLSM